MENQATWARRTNETVGVEPYLVDRGRILAEAGVKGGGWMGEWVNGWMDGWMLVMRMNRQAADQLIASVPNAMCNKLKCVSCMRTG